MFQDLRSPLGKLVGKLIRDPLARAMEDDNKSDAATQTLRKCTSPELQRPVLSTSNGRRTRKKSAKRKGNHEWPAGTRLGLPPPLPLPPSSPLFPSLFSLFSLYVYDVYDVYDVHHVAHSGLLLVESLIHAAARPRVHGCHGCRVH